MWMHLTGDWWYRHKGNVVTAAGEDMFICIWEKVGATGSNY